MEINGIAHIQLSVRNVKESTNFYEPLLHFLGLKTLMQSDEFFYCIGARTGVAIGQVDPKHADDAFDQRRIGLHHICFRAREREDIDELHDFVLGLGATIIHGPQEGAFAPGYYSVLFEDPDGIRIEVNFVPGKGHFAKKE
jgi:catechol 2,3-dioxygenase-like lactoylglutathione lyase family enzyme